MGFYDTKLNEIVIHLLPINHFLSIDLKLNVQLKLS